MAVCTKAIPNAYLQGGSKNKFTGKERDEDFGLNWDYFAGRTYDWLIGRWPTVDPLWQKHPDVTPYNYVLNNPLRLVNPDGRQVDFYDMLLIDQGLREKRYSEQVIQDLHKGEARGVLLGAAIGIGGILAAEVWSYLLTAALFNPVTTNEIGIAITEALSPGAENLTSGAIGKSIDEGIDAARALSKTTDVAMTSKGAYEIAKDGGKHSGLLEQYTGKTTREIRKALSSYEKQVAIHKQKLVNPARFAERWSKMTAKERQGLMRKWENDIQRNQELADIMEGLLKESDQ